MASSGNFCTWLSTHYQGGSGSTTTFSFGNCRVGTTSGGYPLQISNFAFPRSGKWYIELNNIVNNGYHCFGIIRQANILYGNAILDGTGAYQYQGWNGQKRGNGGSASSYGSSFGSVGDVIGLAFDADNGKIWWAKNNTWQASGDPAGNSNEAFSGLDASDTYYFGWSDYYTANPGTVHINCGQDSSFGDSKTSGSANAADGNGFGDFYYTPPTGFLALCSANLPISDDIDPAQTDDDYPSKQFFISQYAGNLTNRTITTENQADLILIRTYDNAQDWYIVDSTRGITANKFTLINTNAAESTLPQANFTSVGATSVGISSGTYLNSTGANYQMWMWHCNGGTTTSDSSGDITVTRQTNDAAKFTIATWTGNGVSGSTIAHGLGVKPAMTWIKKRNATAAHGVWHQGYNDGDYDSFGELLGNAAWYANQGVNGHFSAAPGTDYLTLTAYSQVNTSSDTYVGYFWADVEGMQRFGNYEGNGNADGPFIYTGFRPRLIFIKNADTSGRYWTVIDTARNNSNLADDIINFDQNIAQYTSSARGVDILSNGFKIRGNDSDNNTSGDTYVFGAWGDVPFKYGNTF